VDVDRLRHCYRVGRERLASRASNDPNDERARASTLLLREETDGLRGSLEGLLATELDEMRHSLPREGGVSLLL
jgi:hypothetical protein